MVSDFSDVLFQSDPFNYQPKQWQPPVAQLAVFLEAYPNKVRHLIYPSPWPLPHCPLGYQIRCAFTAPCGRHLLDPSPWPLPHCHLWCALVAVAMPQKVLPHTASPPPHLLVIRR